MSDAVVMSNRQGIRDASGLCACPACWTGENARQGKSAVLFPDAHCPTCGVALDWSQWPEAAEYAGHYARSPRQIAHRQKYPIP